MAIGDPLSVEGIAYPLRNLLGEGTQGSGLRTTEVTTIPNRFWFLDCRKEVAKARI